MCENLPDPAMFAGKRSVLIMDTLLNGRKTDIFIDETGIITETGESAGKHRAEADWIIDGSRTLAMPGLVNAHTHAAMSLLRGYADDMHLQQWLSEKIWPLEAHLTGEDVYWGTKLACLEMIKTGTVAFNDMYFFMEEAARAVDEAGIRALLCHGFITFGDPEKFEKEIKATDKMVSHIRSMNNPRIQPAVGPHAVYTVPPEHLTWCGEYSREQKIPLHIHLSETKQEVDDCIKAQGMTPAALLDKCGCLTDQTIAAHGCWLDDEECALLAKRGTHIVHNPVSNMKLATGRAMPYPVLHNAGVNVTLGTDGCSSNNNLDLLEEMKTAAICQKFFWNQDTLLPAEEAFRMGTSAGAHALGLKTGVIREGTPADIILISLDNPAMVPLYNPISNIVYSANGGLVDTVLCNGRILMLEKYIPGETEICRNAEQHAMDLVERARTTQN